MATDDEGSFVPAGEETRVEGPTGPNDSGTEGQSEATSVAEDTVEALNVDDLVDMTTDLVCRVRMRRLVGGDRMTCVCGGVAGQCRRKGHNAKRRAGGGNVAPALYYERVPGRNLFDDGRLDRGYSAEQVQRMREEDTANESGMEPSNGDDPMATTDGDSLPEENAPVPRTIRRTERNLPSQNTPIRPTNLGAPRRHSSEHYPDDSQGGDTMDGSGAIPHLFPWEEEEDRSVPQRRTSTLNRAPSGPTVNPGTRRRAPRHIPQAAPQAAPLWFGLLEGEHGNERVICGTMEDLHALISEGAVHSQTFLDETQATVWLTEPIPRPLPTSTIRRPPRRQHDSRGQGVGPDHVTPVVVNRRGRSDPDLWVVEDPPRPRERQHTQVQFVGSDPSTGDSTRIYGQVWEDTDAFDRNLAPRDLADSEIPGLLNRALDVGTLPGTYAGYNMSAEISEEYEGLAAVINQVNGDRKGNHGRDPLWRNPKRNALGNIKGFKELMTFATKIERAEERAFKSQRNQVTQYLHKRGFTTVSISDYIDRGNLMRLVRKTYEHYLALINTIRSIAYEEGASRWKGYHAYTMLAYHSEELGVIRTTAGNYRTHLLDTYAYLRDARAKRFQSHTTQKAVWNRLIELETTSTGTEETPKPVDNEARCPHCHRKHLHTGGRARCPGKDLSNRIAQKALRGIGDLQIARHICRLCKDRLKGDDDPNEASVLADARRECIA